MKVDFFHLNSLLKDNKMKRWEKQLAALCILVTNTIYSSEWD